MSTVKFRQFPISRSFNSFLDDFLNQNSSLYRDDFTTGVNHFIPVNVIENENGYRLEVVAPGFNKEDFKVNVEKNVLTVSAEKKTEETKNAKHIRKEYTFQSFKRAFTLNDKIDSEKIEGKYENGVLTLNLQHKAEVKAPVKQISIQ